MNQEKRHVNGSTGDGRFSVYVARLVSIALLCLTLTLQNACQPVPHSPDVISAQTTAAPPVTAQPSIPNIDADADGIVDSLEEEIINRYAPLVKLHPDEQYLPADITWFLTMVKMSFDVRLGIDPQILQPHAVTSTNLLCQTNGGQVSGLCASPTNFFLEQTDASGKDSLDTYRKQTRTGNERNDWVCYAHVRFAPGKYQGTYDIQYIFFYAYNGDMAWGPVESAHEADFEHITVRLDADLKTILGIYYSAHDGEGKWYSQPSSPDVKDGYSITADGHPIVFSGLDSHASYPWSGQWKRSGKPDDFTKDGGLEWDCRTKVVNLGEKAFPREGMEWLQYSGRWGEIGQFSWTCGPYGPAYQDWWNADPD